MLFELTGTDKWMAWTAIAGGVTETQIQGTVGDLRIVRIDFNRYYKTQQYPGRGVVECWQIEPVAADPEEAGDPGGGRVPLAIESSTTATGPWKQVGTTSAPATSDAEFYRLRIER
jgi:hypothetical protein